MASTAQSIITDAFQKLTLHAVGENPTAAESALGLQVLNDMLDSWSNEKLACFAALDQSIALAVGVQRYPLGTGSIYSTSRPLAIADGPGSAYCIDPSNQTYSVDVRSQQEWNLISYLATTGNYPTDIFYDPQFPQGILNVFPIPNASGYTLHIMSRLQLTDFATLATAVSLPPGYLVALKNNLAVALAPYFSVKPSDEIKEAARETKAIIKRTNNKAVPAFYDPELIAKANATYNIYSDTPNR